VNKAEFRGLRYEPSYEDEVLILFSMLIPHFKDRFVIDSYTGAFPDCYATRNGEAVGIEFELLSSHFFEHRHDQDEKLAKCNMIVCWKNNIHTDITKTNGKEFLDVGSHRIEIMALDEIAETLKSQGILLILEGKRPNQAGANKERFFEQLRENVGQEKRVLVDELYRWVSQRREFEIKWGQGRRFSTMRIFVRSWEVDPISLDSNGIVTIGYQGNPSINHWVLPEGVESELRRLFGHGQQKWPSAPFSTRDDYLKIIKALEVLADYSKKSDVLWRKPT
jgi:hypothetical protein